MFHTAKEHTIYLAGSALQTDADRTIPLKKGWNVFPYLRMDNKNLRDVLSAYYSYAAEGDMIKSHDEFAVFSENKKWEGNLTYLQPGRGYLFFRQGKDEVSFTFPASSLEAPMAPAAQHAPARRYATNMTMIAKVEGAQDANDGLRAFIGSEQVGMAMPVVIGDEVLYFLTISSNLANEVRFETEDGERLMPVANVESLNGASIRYTPDAHYGSLKAPLVLKPAENAQPYKIIENEHVVIIKNGEKYDIVGKKL